MGTSEALDLSATLVDTICNNSPLVICCLRNSFAAWIKEPVGLMPCNYICLSWYMNPIINCLKSQLIRPRVQSHWVPSTTLQPPRINTCKFTMNSLPRILSSRSLHSPLVLIKSPLAIFTSKILVVSTANFKVLTKTASRKLWELLVSKRITIQCPLIWPNTLMVPGEGLSNNAYKVISAWFNWNYVVKSPFPTSTWHTSWTSSIMNSLRPLHLCLGCHFSSQ